MPELAPLQIQPPHGSCPTAEDLACYIDGALSPKEAARITEHLASCESCFEVYSEVLRFQLESEPAPWGTVVPFPGEKWLPPVPWWSSIAALLVVGVGIGGYSYLLAPPPTLAAARLAAPFQGRSGLAQSQWKGEIKRGGSEGEDVDSVPYRVASFRTGVQVVNLQVSLQANDGKNATDYVIPGIYGTLHDTSGMEGLANDYKDISLSISKGEAPKSLLPKTKQLANEARELDPLYFDLGQWVEAGRLAAISQNSAFFRQPENLSFLRRVLWRDRLGFKDSKLPAESRGDLAEIYKIAGQGTLQSSDFKALQDHFEKILDANYPK
jgi:hypothetical protein